MSLESIMLNEVTQIQKDKNHSFPLHGPELVMYRCMYRDGCKCVCVDTKLERRPKGDKTRSAKGEAGTQKQNGGGRGSDRRGSKGKGWRHKGAEASTETKFESIIMIRNAFSFLNKS